MLRLVRGRNTGALSLGSIPRDSTSVAAEPTPTTVLLSATLIFARQCGILLPAHTLARVERLLLKGLQTMATEVAKTGTASTEVELRDERIIGVIKLNTFHSGGKEQTREDQARLYLALDTPKSLKREKMIGKKLMATNLIIREETFIEAKTGRVSYAPSVVIETADKGSFYMSSSSLAETAQNMATAFRAETWAADPMPVSVVEEISSNGRPYYRMVPALG